jgi:hypothetical protein
MGSTSGGCKNPFQRTQVAVVELECEETPTHVVVDAEVPSSSVRRLVSRYHRRYVIDTVGKYGTSIGICIALIGFLTRSPVVKIIGVVITVGSVELQYSGHIMSPLPEHLKVTSSTVRLRDESVPLTTARSAYDINWGVNQKVVSDLSEGAQNVSQGLGNAVERFSSVYRRSD